MKTNIQNVRGTQDFFNTEVKKFNCVIDIAKQNAKKYNFKEIAQFLKKF